MSATPLAVLSTGLVTSVGLTGAASCAAIRTKISNPTETRFIDSRGEWLIAHCVPLEQPWFGRPKLVKMAALAIEDCLEDVPRDHWSRIPLLLCVSEPERPGRLKGLDDELYGSIQHELGAEFAEQSLIIRNGRVSAATALLHARKLITEDDAPLVLIAATDSLLNWQTLRFYERQERLLTAWNSNGFLPGEGAGALLLGRDTGNQPQLLLCGLGFATEPATVEGEQPLRGEGLALAIRRALQEADCALHDLDFRIADVSGEQYYFKEAALALSRVLRTRKEAFDIWHPAECIGEAGSVSGLATLVVAETACRKAYAPGPGILCHAANDGGERAAAVLRYRVS